MWRQLGGELFSANCLFWCSPCCSGLQTHVLFSILCIFFPLGEAGVPFFSVSGANFDEVFVGVGMKRVKALFGKLIVV